MPLPGLWEVWMVWERDVETEAAEMVKIRMWSTKNARSSK